MNNADLKTVFTSKAIIVLGIKIIGTGIGIGLQIYLARVLGVKMYGDYVYALTWILLFSPVAGMGLNRSSIPIISGYLVDGSDRLLRGFQRRGIQTVFIISFTISMLFIFVVMNVVDKDKSHELYMTMIVSALILPVISLIEAFGGFIKSFNKVIAAEAIQIIIRPTLFVIFLVATFASTKVNMHTASIVMMIHVGALLLTLAAIVIYWGKSTSQLVSKCSPDFNSRKWLAHTLPFIAISGISYLLTQTDVLMIGLYIGTEDAGIYSVASKISLVMSFGLVATSAISAPMIAKLYRTNQFVELQTVVQHAARLAFAYAVISAIVIFVWGDTVVRMFGQDFMSAYTMLVILAAGQVVNSIAGPVGLIMAMTGNQSEAMRIMFFFALLNVMLNHIFINAHGAIGAAIATSVTMVIWNFLLIYRVIKLLRFNPTALNMNRLLGDYK
jgi:O-antigen/teichoic acid export membrane protein